MATILDSSALRGVSPRQLHGEVGDTLGSQESLRDRRRIAAGRWDLSGRASSLCSFSQHEVPAAMGMGPKAGPRFWSQAIFGVCRWFYVLCIAWQLRTLNRKACVLSNPAASPFSVALGK